jgi:hypothetical protein
MFSSRLNLFLDYDDVVAFHLLLIPRDKMKADSHPFTFVEQPPPCVFEQRKTRSRSRGIR